MTVPHMGGEFRSAISVTPATRGSALYIIDTDHQGKLTMTDYSTLSPQLENVR